MRLCHTQPNPPSIHLRGVILVAILCIPASVFADRIIFRADVYDSKTDLTWQRCSVGMRLEQDSCVGIQKNLTWSEAQKLAGQGWRVPSKEELQTLLDSNNSMRDSSSFPDMRNLPISQVSTYWYWSSSPDDQNKLKAWAVHMSGGGAENDSRNSHFAVRLVHKGVPKKTGDVKTSWSPSVVDNTSSSAERWVLNSGEAFDKKTGLTWQRCSVGSNWVKGKGCAGEPKRFNWYDAQNQASLDWRVPGIDELRTLSVISSKHNYNIDPIVFPEVVPIVTNGKRIYPRVNTWWSSTSGANATAIAFLNGSTSELPRSFSSNGVRLVRGTMPGSAGTSPSSSSTANPSGVSGSSRSHSNSRVRSSAVETKPECYAKATVTSSAVNPAGTLNVMIDVTPKYCQSGCSGEVNYVISVRGSALNRRDMRGQNPKYELSGNTNWSSHDGRTVTVRDQQGFGMLCGAGMICEVTRERIGFEMFGSGQPVTCRNN